MKRRDFIKTSLTTVAAAAIVQETDESHSDTSTIQTIH